MKDYLPHENLYEKSIELLKNRGVNINDIAKIVYHLQCEYFPNITDDECEYQVKKVLKKREIQNAIITGIELDILAENKMLNSPLLEMLIHDDSLYGIDEIISLSIVNVYGSIGFTNYGYVDKIKPGIVGELNKHKNNQVNTFLDDIVGAIAAATSSRIAHNYDPFNK